MRRKVIILCLLLVLILPGCSEPTPTPQLVSPPPTPSLLTPTPTQEPRPMIITLHLWLPEELDPYGDGPGAEVLLQRLGDFSETYPDLQVETTIKAAHGAGGLLDFLHTAQDAAPSILPDLVVLDTAELEAAAEAGLIQPLDELPLPTEASDIFPFAEEQGTVNGQPFGFVIGADMQLLVYRSPLFKSPPVSWTQVISPPVSFLFAAGESERTVDDATLIQYLAAGGCTSDEEGRPQLDSNALEDALGFYENCVDSDAVSADVLDIVDADQAWEQFQAGAGGIAAVQVSHYLLANDAALSISHLPTQDGRPLSIARGWVLVLVTQDPDRQQQAILLFNWLIASDHYARWTQAAGYLPATRSAMRQWVISEADRAVLRSVMEAAVPPPRPEVMGVVGPPMQKALEDVLTRQADPKTAALNAANSLGP